MTHPNSTPVKRLEPSGVIELSLGADQYATLVAAGVLGALPVTTWLLMSMTPLGLEAPRRALPERWRSWPSSSSRSWSCSSCRSSRRGAAIGSLAAPASEWEDEVVIEWDGPWKKTFIAWPELRATQVTWVTKTRSGSITDEALQLGAEAKTAITCWTSKPRRSPVVRRRVCSARVVELRRSARRIPLANGLDFDSSATPIDRRTARSIVGRIGYPLRGPRAPSWRRAPPSGASRSAPCRPCSSARAAPVFGELRAIRARRRSLRRTISGDEAVGPYRAAFAPAPDEDAGHLARDRFKARAAMNEAVDRGGCVVMTLASTALSLAFPADAGFA